VVTGETDRKAYDSRVCYSSRNEFNTYQISTTILGLERRTLFSETRVRLRYAKIPPNCRATRVDMSRSELFRPLEISTAGPPARYVSFTS